MTNTNDAAPVAIDPESAARQLAGLADAYDAVQRARVKCEERTEAAKDAKQALVEAIDRVMTLVRDATHPPPLPLFDVSQAEADRAAMTSAPGEL